MTLPNRHLVHDLLSQPLIYDSLFFIFKNIKLNFLKLNCL
jgi:hypothetical protein